jgi:hypothetical protein
MSFPLGAEASSDRGYPMSRIDILFLLLMSWCIGLLAPLAFTLVTR